MDVIYMPCFKRPEFLKLAIDYLKKNKEAKTMFWVFQVDYGYDPDVIKIIKRADVNGQIYYTPNHNYGEKSKLLVNILEGYRNAVKHSDRFVFMVEEDVFVSNQFINWSIQVQEQQNDLFCSIATRNNNTDITETHKEPGAYYTISGDYQSLGVCYHKDVLENYVLTHANHSYYSDRSAYCKKHFPNSSIGHIYVEQAGLIRRVQEQNPELKIAFPFTGLAFHAGWYGKNRGQYVSGSLMEKVAKVKDTVFDVNKLKKVVKNPNHIKDSTPVELSRDNCKAIFKGCFS